jgi:Uma2 family endonuclease
MTLLTAAAPPLPLLVTAPGEDDALYEVVNDRYVECPRMSTYSTILASRLHGRLAAWAETQQTGQAVCEGIFGLVAKPRLWRRPDVAFVSYQRWAKGKSFPFTDPFPVVPELAVEVVSPSDLAEELRVRVADYFRHGVLVVWVVWPKLQMIDVYESLTQVRILTRDQVLDGGPVLPGFQLPLGDLFREAPPQDSPADEPHA